MEDHPTGIAALDERIPFLLSQLGSHVAGEFQRGMSGIGVQPRTHGVLMALATEDGQSQRQLSARLGIHRNATTATKVLGFAKVAKFCGGISPSMAAAAARTNSDSSSESRMDRRPKKLQVSRGNFSDSS